MSSDSELDEFYDAEDVTPDKSVLDAVTEGCDNLDDLEEEERELLELKRRQEERRRKEDEELQARLRALQSKKKEEKEKHFVSSDYDKKEHLEKRRRKHEELRRKISEKGDNSEDASSSSTDSETDSVDGTNPVLRLDQSDGDTIDSAPPVIVTPPTCDTDLCDKYGELSVNINSCHPEKEKVTKHLHDFVDDNSKTETIDHNMIDAENIVENVLQETQLLNEENEPDIIRSTKTRTPPNTLQTMVVTPANVVQPPKDLPAFTFSEPVAPPRKKKKSRVESATDGSISSRCSVSSLPSDDVFRHDAPQSPGLPAEAKLLTPHSHIDKLTVDLEHSLDLRNLIRGRKHINAEDAEVDAVNSDHDSPRQTLDTGSSTTSNHTSTLDMQDGDSAQNKSASLERDGKKGKASSLDRNGKKSKSASLDRKTKSLSLEKEEKKRGRHGSGQEPVGRKESMKRPRSGSGKLLTDEEILMGIMVKNLDTGESVPLKDADQAIQKCMDPLALHIMERTNDYHSEPVSDQDYDARSEGGQPLSTEKMLKKKGKRLKKLFGKKVGKTVTKMKTVADHVMHGEENTTVVKEDEVSEDGRRFKFKANHNKKGPYDFGQLQFIQDLSGEHTGAIWTMKFSPCGRLLATGGQDSVLRIWVLESAFSYFDDMRQKYVEMSVSPAPSQDSLNSIPSSSSDMSSMDLGATAAETEEENKGPFKTKPFCKYRGHSADLLDISWSKNYFILSSSMDKTVRLWHLSRRECLCTFQHIDFVTAIVFHPRDDRYFLSGSLDGKLRLWNIPDKKVTMWNEVGSGSLITTANFCHNGKFAVVGTYDGKCIFYSTEHLKYYTQIHVRSTRGKNSRGQKITGIEPLPGEDKVLVTSNDSRIRLYDLRDLTLTCKYKGPTNSSSQIRASFSTKGKYLVCGSEDHFVYLWRTQHEFYKFSSARRDRNDYYEAAKVHNAVVTVALFAPNPSHFFNTEESSYSKKQNKDVSQDKDAEFVISSDFMGCIKIIRAK